MKNSKYLNFLVISLLLIFTVIIFQNCGNINLRPPEKIKDIILPTTTQVGTLCSSLDSYTYEITKFYIINLTAKMHQGSLLSDSDMDGLPDLIETSSTVNFDPLNARTNGIVLDSICASPSGNVCNITGCNSNSYSQFGLSECDINSFSSPSFPITGIDSDRDEMLDFIEIIRDSSLDDENSNLANPDGDFNTSPATPRTNLQEILEGTDLDFSDSNISDLLKNRYQFFTTDEATLNCPSNQTTYSFKLNNIPLVNNLQAYVDPMGNIPVITGNSISLSHLANQNVIVIFFVTRPWPSSPSQSSKIYAHVIKQYFGEELQEFELTNSDFSLIGEF